jgi:hypothetical protein
MNRIQSARVWIGAGLLAGSAAVPAMAQVPAVPAAPPAPSQDAYVVTLAAAISQSRDALWVLDREARKLAVYRVDNAGLSLIAVRDLKADFHCIEFSNEGRRQAPTVLQMKKAADTAAAKPAAPGAPPLPAVDLAPQPVGNLLMTRAAYESGRDVVHLLDSQARKLAVYTSDGRSLTLLHVRDLRVDLVPVEFDGGPPQSPTVGTMGVSCGGK